MRIINIDIICSVLSSSFIGLGFPYRETNSRYQKHSAMTTSLGSLRFEEMRSEQFSHFKHPNLVFTVKYSLQFLVAANLPLICRILQWRKKKKMLEMKLWSIRRRWKIALCKKFEQILQVEIFQKQGGFCSSFSTVIPTFPLKKHIQLTNPELRVYKPHKKL